MALGCARVAQISINILRSFWLWKTDVTPEEVGEVLRLEFFRCDATSLIPAAELFEELN